MSKADGSVIIDTELDITGIKKGTKEVAKELGDLKEDLGDVGAELGDVGKNSDAAGSKLSGSLASGFSKLGKVLVSAQIAGKIIDIGKEAIELGSDLEEVQNVVDVTFTTMSDNVNDFAKAAKKSAGLSETMAKQYVGTFGAMADSFGFTEKEAYEMSTALTQLTGDVASFYNLSQDEAMNKLKGVFTGETEALKELGVVMTQAALDNYALANGYEKTTSAMTEQEKVALRYQFVMDQLAASSGDFARTQDSWANQSKVLSLQWESLMATLGTGLIDVMAPGLEFLNDKFLPALQQGTEYLSELMEPSNSTKLQKDLKQIAENVEKANVAFQDSAEAIDQSAVKAELYRGMLKDLEEAGLETAEAQAQYVHIVEKLNELYPEMNLKISEHTGMLDADSQAQLANLEVMKERALQAALENQYAEVLNAQATATMAVTEAQNAFNDTQVQKAALIQQIVAETGLEIDQLYELDVAQRKGEKTTTELTKTQQATLQTITLLTGEENKLTNTIKKGQKEIADYDAQLDSLRETYGLTGDEAGDFANQQEGVSDGLTEAAQAAQDAQAQLETLQSEYDNARDAAYSSISSQVGLFDELTVESSASTSQIIKNWESQRVAFDNYKSNLEKAVDMGLDEALVKQLSDGSKESMAILEEFVNTTDVSVDDINTAFRKTEESKEIVAATMADVQTEMSDKLAALRSSVSSAWGDMAYTVSHKIQQMQNSINSLKGTTVSLKITANSSSGGGHIDVNTGMPIVRSVAPATDVPYLASGAVIPPNAPFMAVLGDQRHGTNIEAPLATIQEAVALEMADVVGCLQSGFGALIEETVQLRSTVENIELTDEAIHAAYNRRERIDSVVRGW